MKEMWLTKKEMLQLSNSELSPAAGARSNRDENIPAASVQFKFKQKKLESQNSSGLPGISAVPTSMP